MRAGRSDWRIGKRIAGGGDMEGRDVGFDMSAERRGDVHLDADGERSPGTALVCRGLLTGTDRLPSKICGR